MWALQGWHLETLKLRVVVRGSGLAILKKKKHPESIGFMGLKGKVIHGSNSSSMMNGYRALITAHFLTDTGIIMTQISAQLIVLEDHHCHASTLSSPVITQDIDGGNYDCFAKAREHQNQFLIHSTFSQQSSRPRML
ncbi:hypothetical protein DM860_005043 [Cuscuta australis]|uniref:Uncharacterized protein n=1 Tax=Cuscuta australis TaxID=267555 RepID=A0A328DMC4_9ASTE|nr:hypothetical protein DM860_005043 [Cuscuta australis]